ncbi:hypothetical protein [Metapseudomonas otitidis]|uniref:hypothetical protein n=1 Tax=Metapseudomonas otitidis TaxID=319939 RepID=UPI00209B740B|nr:hypothetical protein [Pseudomonas otitidis]MCO7557051.1 hypothetical protein [Pseudomonas otitidis]
MSAFLKALRQLLEVANLVLTLVRDDKLRQEGERKARQEALEAEQQRRGEAHEIDLQVARGGLSDADLERMRRYQRASR